MWLTAGRDLPQRTVDRRVMTESIIAKRLSGPMVVAAISYFTLAHLMVAVASTG